MDMREYKRHLIPPLYNVQRLKEKPIPKTNCLLVSPKSSLSSTNSNPPIEIQHIEIANEDIVNQEEQIRTIEVEPELQNDPLQNEANQENEEKYHFPPVYRQIEEERNADFLRSYLSSGITFKS